MGNERLNQGRWAILKKIGTVLARMIGFLLAGVVIYLGFPETLLILHKVHFLTPPPPAISNSLSHYSGALKENRWCNYAKTMVLFLVILMFIAMTASSWHKRPWKGWVLVAFFVLCLVLPLLHDYFSAIWTCEWQGQRL